MIGIQGRDQTLGSKLFGSKSEIREGNPDCRQRRQLFIFWGFFSTAKLISTITKNAKILIHITQKTKVWREQLSQGPN